MTAIAINHGSFDMNLTKQKGLCKNHICSQAHQTRPNSGGGGCKGPAKIQQRGGCNNFFTFYLLKISLLEFLRKAIKKGILLRIYAIKSSPF